jgi:hypothetical protein
MLKLTTFYYYPVRYNLVTVFTPCPATSLNYKNWQKSPLLLLTFDVKFLILEKSFDRVVKNYSFMKRKFVVYFYFIKKKMEKQKERFYIYYTKYIIIHTVLPWQNKKISKINKIFQNKTENPSSPYPRALY